MKAPIATFSMTCLLLATAADAQVGRPRGSARPAAPADDSTAPKSDPKVFQAVTVLPAPIAPDQLKPATLALPTDAIEPWLLTKQSGPFLVIAKTFRGPEAERYALALAKELRQDYNLPAYILRTKDFPMRTNLRNIPPTAPSYVNKASLTEPEKVRSYDEAAVLVGDEKTLADSEALLNKVKKIKPKCLDDMPSIFGWRVGQGLSTAIRTTNPYLPTQILFPDRGQRDSLVTRLNGGPRSVFKCPGRYSLQVAQFSGRSVFNPNAGETFDNSWFKKSPLATAHAEAEHLAELLAKNPKFRATGAQAYVYHDRTSSKVLVGSFNSPNEPAAVAVRNVLMQLPGDTTGNNAGIVLAPATALTDLEDPTNPIKTH